MQTEPIRNKKHIREMAGYYLKQGKLRNYLLIVLGVNTGLRISDLLRLTKNDVYNFEQCGFRTHIHTIEKKTGKRKSIALNKKVVDALRLCFGSDMGQPEDFLFQTNRKKRAAIGRTQAWRIVKEAANAIGVAGIIGVHSLRKTLGYHAWKAGVEAVLLMDIFNHSSFEVTKRYLGISQDDRDKVYLNLALI
jgi:Site-specific recombinase XerD